jgi:hypothetical protein
MKLTTWSCCWNGAVAQHVQAEGSRPTEPCLTFLILNAPVFVNVTKKLNCTEAEVLQDLKHNITKRLSRGDEVHISEEENYHTVNVQILIKEIQNYSGNFHQITH